MTMRDDLPIKVTHEVRDRCLCLHLQRAARAIARRFDDALRPHGLTNGQFSLLMALNQRHPPRIGEIASLLAMDRTTLTANLKPLERRGLIEIIVDSNDHRSRRLKLSDDGRDVLGSALQVWRDTHDEIDMLLGKTRLDKIRADLLALS
jgi:DNA-binding MarR family transcriptional regulator